MISKLKIVDSIHPDYSGTTNKIEDTINEMVDAINKLTHIEEEDDKSNARKTSSKKMVENAEFAQKKLDNMQKKANKVLQDFEQQEQDKTIYNVFKCYSVNGTLIVEEIFVESYSNKEEAKKHVEFIKQQIKNGKDDVEKTFYEKTTIIDKFIQEDWDDMPVEIAHLD